MVQQCTSSSSKTFRPRLQPLTHHFETATQILPENPFDDVRKDAAEHLDRVVPRDLSLLHGLGVDHLHLREHLPSLGTHDPFGEFDVLPSAAVVLVVEHGDRFKSGLRAKEAWLVEGGWGVDRADEQVVALGGWPRARLFFAVCDFLVPP